ncbi:hypothetical protein [Noviherbaspirillum denitrificans]|uniref:hypothetical protein n=1 Tax=Noviherbaspirillum denitrificans TaxID=1968433 RepID=UPI00112FDDB7|nr:hypothetical protein [Noviherbaspirillum denitrificans]
MVYRGDHLFQYERQALIDALARDVRSERSNAAAYPEWRDYHLRNAWLSARVLEVLGFREDGSSAACAATDDREQSPLASRACQLVALPSRRQAY